MSEMAKTARAAMKEKAHRMAGPGSDKSMKIDASGWSEPTDMNTTAPTGMRPVSRRQYKSGGKVEGPKAAARADRKGRADSYINRDVRAANHEIGAPHVGGFASGGATNFRKQMHGMMEVPENHHGRRNGVGKFHRSHKASGGAACAEPAKKAVHKHEKHDHKGEPLTKLKHGGRAHKDVGGVLSMLSPALMAEKGLRGGKLDEGLKHGGRTHKAAGGSAGGYADIAGMRPKGDREPRKHGGKAKGKTQIIIGINAGGQGQQKPPMPVAMPHPAAPPPPPMPPQGGPPIGAGGPPGGMPPGMMPPGMPMPRAMGGKVVGAKYGDASIAKAEKVKSPKGIPGGAGGLGRLAKSSIARKDGFKPV